MFNRKKNEKEKEKRLLEEALDVTATDITEASQQEKEPEEQPTQQSTTERLEEEISVTASTIPDDAPEIGPSYKGEPDIEIAPYGSNVEPSEEFAVTIDEDLVHMDNVDEKKESPPTSEPPSKEVQEEPQQEDSEPEEVVPQEDEETVEKDDVAPIPSIEALMEEPPPIEPSTEETHVEDVVEQEPDSEQEELDGPVEKPQVHRFDWDSLNMDQEAEEPVQTDPIEPAFPVKTEPVLAEESSDEEDKHIVEQKTTLDDTEPVQSVTEEPLEDDVQPDDVDEVQEVQEVQEVKEVHEVQAVEEVSFDLPKKDKVDLNSFFEAGNQTNKLKRRDKKKYSRRELKRRKKRHQRDRMSDDITDQRVFKFRKKKYKEVEEFITYLNDHYLDIDDVANDVLADENFFGWISKRSGVFPQSLEEFKEIKKKIDSTE